MHSQGKILTLHLALDRGMWVNINEIIFKPCLHGSILVHQLFGFREVTHLFLLQGVGKGGNGMWLKCLGSGPGKLTDPGERTCSRASCSEGPPPGKGRGLGNWTWEGLTLSPLTSPLPLAPGMVSWFGHLCVSLAPMLLSCPSGGPCTGGPCA